MFFNALHAKPTPPLSRPIEEQEERESQRLWYKTAQAVRVRNHELATDEKTKIEELQREEAAARANEGVEWRPRLFRRVKGGPGGPDEGEEDLEWIINAEMYVLLIAILDYCSMLTGNRDGESPEKQAAQIMAIFPIVKGQKWEAKNVIPPRASISGPAAPTPSSSKLDEGDLIDFGQNESSTEHQELTEGQKKGELQSETKPPLDSAHNSTAEIQQMLASTGTRAPQGPLVDFHQGMKKSIPSKPKRVDTDDSNDEFVDAQG